jgi:hypothetical protein
MTDVTTFKTIRIWEGSQDRAFEELSYQLLQERADLPAAGDCEPIRTGNPDGGVEWYVDLPDKTQWGWQAKYIFGIDPLLNAMTATVHRVVNERPNLTRLTFIIPWQLPAGKQGGKTKSARHKYEDKVDVWRTTISGADKVDFKLVQGSDLLSRLSHSKHSGRRLFWWDEPHLGLDDLRRLHGIAAEAAGRRYRPELQVDLPIGEDIAALGFGDDYFRALFGHRVELAGAVRYAHGPRKEIEADVRAACDEALAKVRALLKALTELDPQARDVDVLDPLIAMAEKSIELLDRAREKVYELERALESKDGDHDGAVRELRNDTYDVVRLRGPVYQLATFLDTERSQAVRRRAYFLTGDAGTGKTHLLLDAADRALKEKRPAVVLLGEWLGGSGLWASIADGLGLRTNLAQDELLGALDACGEAASLSGRRFVLAIDALNESTPPNFWTNHLPRLRAAIASWPHISLVVSVRSTYVETIDPDDRRSADYVCRAHPGFAGREAEATQKYFHHWHLSEPRIPLLLPEFINPLFLQFYCQTLKDAGLTAPPDHHESRVVIFERFVKGAFSRAARRLAPSGSNVERRAVEQDCQVLLDRILDFFIDHARESLTLAETDGVLEGLSLASGHVVSRVLGSLVDEGVLARDRVWSEDQLLQGFRISFQAFGDFLILRRRLQGLSRDALADDLDFCHWVTVQTPSI